MLINAYKQPVETSYMDAAVFTVSTFYLSLVNCSYPLWFRLTYTVWLIYLTSFSYFVLEGVLYASHLPI